MTLSELSYSIARRFKEYMNKHGFDSFKDMRTANKWNDHDVRAEIEYAAVLLLKDDYSEFLNSGGDPDKYNRIVVFDNGSLSDSSQDFSFSDFKRSILANLARM